MTICVESDKIKLIKFLFWGVIMGKRISSLFLAVCLLFSFCFIFAGCSKDGSGEYPVVFDDVTINEEPKNIVVLNDCIADIISYIGYDVKMVGRSVSCDQDFLTVVPVVGASDSPSVDLIKSNGTDLVICDETLNSTAREKLKNEKINVVTLSVPNNKAELETLYENIGMILGGKNIGREKGAASFSELYDTMKSYQSSVSKKIVKADCYLFLSESGQLATFKSGSLQSEMFSYNAAVNIFSEQKADQEIAIVDKAQLKMGTPTFIFYDNDNVLQMIENDSELSNMSAVTQNRMYQIPLKNFYRYGTTFDETLYEMMTYMYIDSEATPDSETMTQSPTPEVAQAQTRNYIE